MAVEVVGLLAAKLGYQRLSQLRLAGAHGADDPHIGMEDTRRIIGIPTHRRSVPQRMPEQDPHGPRAAVPGRRRIHRQRILWGRFFLRCSRSRRWRGSFFLRCGRLRHWQIGLCPQRSRFCRRHRALHLQRRSLRFRRGGLVLSQHLGQQRPAMGAKGAAFKKAIAVAGVIRDFTGAKPKPGMVDKAEAAQDLPLYAALSLVVLPVRQNDHAVSLRLLLKSGV